MPVEVILPKVDMDMATGQITRWYVEEGAVVRQGDVLFEIETDKAAMEVDAPAGGIVRNIVGKAGVDIPVGEPVAWIYAEGEDAPAASPAPRAAAQPDAPASSPPLASPVSSQDTPAPASPAPAGAVRATPLARRLAREAGIEISGVAGSGPRGRVMKEDVEAALAGRARTGAEDAAGAVPPASAPKAMSDEAVLKLFEEGSYELVPHDGMRRTIARRLVEAKSTIPHFYLTLDTEIDALLALRKQLNDGAPLVRTGEGEAPAYKLSVNDMVIKALALALAAVPEANVSWTEAGLLRHAHADVGVAVAIPGGLITPIVRRAGHKTLSAISNEMKDLAERARGRRLKPEEYQGGTTAVSNLGMFGIKDFAAVINPPHATILAVGAGEQRAVVRDGALAVATVMSVTLSTDHRAVDGALGARLLAEFKRLVESPVAMVA